MSKVAVKEIQIVRGEGPCELCGKKLIALDFEGAKKILGDMSFTVSHGGYDKVDFRVKYEDGSEYSGTYDLYSNERDPSPCLSEHIVGNVVFYGNMIEDEQHLPTHIKSLEQYRNLVLQYGQDSIKNQRMWFDTFDLGPAQRANYPIFRRVTPGVELTIGSELHRCGCRENIGVVYMIDDHGGDKTYGVVFDNGTKSPALSERMLRSPAYELYQTVVSVAKVQEMLDYVEVVEKRNAEAAAEKARLRKEEEDRLKVEFDYLELHPDKTAKNIRKVLKKHFPGCKFSVRSRSYGSIDVEWIDGPTVYEVEEQIGKFQEGNFNGMTDSYDYSPSAFTDLFGGCKYLMTRREYSDEAVVDAIDAMFEEFAGNLSGMSKPSVEDFKSGSLYNTYIPGLDSHGYTLQAQIHHFFGKRSYK